MDLRSEGRTGESNIEVILKASGVDGISWGRMHIEKSPGVSPWALQHLEIQREEKDWGVGCGVLEAKRRQCFKKEREQFCSMSMRGQDEDPKVTGGI